MLGAGTFATYTAGEKGPNFAFFPIVIGVLVEGPLFGIVICDIDVLTRACCE